MDVPIQHVLERYPLQGGSIRVLSLGSAGGFSGARFWRISTPSRELILRRWPKEHPRPAELRFIHSVLQHVGRHGLSFVPVPLETQSGDTYVAHQDHLWEITPWMPGTADYRQRPSTSRLAAAMTALARFHLASQGHGTPAADSTAPAISERFKRLDQMRSEGLSRLQSCVRRTVAAKLTPLADRFLRVAQQRLPRAIEQLAPLVEREFSLLPCIRDVWHDHVLFTGEQVTGLIDFGAMRIDTPATDIARLLGSLVGNEAGGWEVGVEAYHRVRQLSSCERQAVPALDLAGSLIGGYNWIRWIYVEQRQFDSLDVVHGRLTELLARLSHDD